MLLVDRKGKTFHPIQSSNFSDLKVLERSDLQKMILSSPESFFKEMGESLKLLGEEVRPSEFIANRIDLLAIDPDGTVVVIELKRDKDRYQLLQALSYAGMIAKWKPDDLIERFTAFSHKTAPEAKAELEEFLDAEDASVLNAEQRVILIAEDYDYEVLITAEWLRNKFQTDIRCYRLSLAVHGDNAFLSCIRIFPPTELTVESISPEDRNAARRLHFKNFDELAAYVENPAVTELLQRELEGQWDSRIARGRWRYRSNNKTRLAFYIRPKFIYVMQFGRFADDEAFWNERLSSAAGVKVITHGHRIRFRLQTATDLAAFREAWRSHVSNARFSEVSEDGVADDEESESVD